jgi:hypothetical protein
MICVSPQTILTNYEGVLQMVVKKNCLVGRYTGVFSSKNGTYRKGNLCARFHIKQYLIAKLKLRC